MSHMAEVRRLRPRSDPAPTAMATADTGEEAGRLAARARAHWARGDAAAALEPYRRALALLDDAGLQAEYLAAAREWGRTAVLRPAWRLLFRAGPGRAARAEATRFGGLPARPAGEPWPRCPAHERPLGFVGQLNLSDAPGAPQPGEHDLLLLFRCRTCAGDAASHRVELRRTDDLADEALCGPEHVPALPAWESIALAHAALEPALDLPDWQDVAPVDRAHALAMLGASHSADDHDAYVRAHQQRFGGGGNLFASKLGGWPHWLHRARQPACHACGGQVRFIAQLDGEPDLGLEWGKLGCAYVFACAAGCSARSGALFWQSL